MRVEIKKISCRSATCLLDPLASYSIKGITLASSHGLAVHGFFSYTILFSNH